MRKRPDASWLGSVDTALIEVLPRQRAGARRFFVRSGEAERTEELQTYLGTFRDSPTVRFVISAAQVFRTNVDGGFLRGQRMLLLFSGLRGAVVKCSTESIAFIWRFCGST